MIEARADTAPGRLGSGFIVDTNGDIMTALHVVAGTTKIKVIFADGATSAASMDSADAEQTDIAVFAAASSPP